jgi:hypothetical protein
MPIYISKILHSKEEGELEGAVFEKLGVKFPNGSSPDEYPIMFCTDLESGKLMHCTVESDGGYEKAISEIADYYKVHKDAVITYPTSTLDNCFKL